MMVPLEASTGVEPPAGILGKHICICGAGGKTTLSRKLGVLLGLPVIELDALFWQPGWRPRPAEEFLRLALGAVAGCTDGWIVDGNYSSTVRPHLLPLADTVIWLRLPLRIVMWRAFRRSIRHARTGEPMCNGNYETWRRIFLNRDPFLLWMLRHHRSADQRIARQLKEIPHAARVITLHSGRQLAAFGRSLGLPDP